MSKPISIGCQIRRAFSGFLLLGAIVLGIWFGLSLIQAPDAAATIRQLEEAPGQQVYQVRQTLHDQHGNTWQAIAFKRLRLDEQASVELRLVGFPGTVAIDHTQPLILTNSLGKTVAADDSSNLFEGRQPEPYIGQYNLQTLLPQLQAEIPLKLSLPTSNGEYRQLLVSPAFIQEWQALSHLE